ncbi:MAG TPA: alpha/beta fold hydrolase [Patescibacteria group bacterium]|nr:alpha/beta fold hydrolase [Patescibacteria group bacterium]
MKRRIIFSLLGLLVFCGSAFGQARPQENGLAGTWLGVLQFPGAELQLVFRIAKNPDGTWQALLDSPDQGAKDIPTSKVVVENERLLIEVQVVAGAFEGKIKADFSEISGQWKQAGLDIPLVLKKTDRVQGPNRPQEPKKPYPYREEEVSYENPTAAIKLAGTLTLPSGNGPFPVVLLITGSGQQDRDETVMGHKPFWVLADYLTRRGIAVLRVDDRGVGGSGGDPALATSLDFSGDVLAGIAYLKSRQEIDPGRIGLIGHSEGGLIAPLAAVKNPKDVAFILLMAGPGIVGEDILLLQGKLINKASNASDTAIALDNAQQKRMFRILKEEKDAAAMEAKLRQAMKDTMAKMSVEEQKKLPPAIQEASLQMIMSPWFRFFLTYDPRPTLQKVTCPLLAINGEKDLQVPAEENLKAIAEALKAGGNDKFTVKQLSGLNHLFQTAPTGSPSEYAKIEETIAPAALRLIGDWILERTAK